MRQRLNPRRETEASLMSRKYGSYRHPNAMLRLDIEKFSRQLEKVSTTRATHLRQSLEGSGRDCSDIWVGDKGRDVYNTWTLTNDEKKKLDTYYQRFKAYMYVQPKLNPVFSRFKFNNEVQGQQSIEQFVTRLRLLAKDCQYNDADEMIRDRIVFGTNSAKIREKLINED